MPNKIDKILKQFISQVSNLIGNRLKKSNIIWLLCKRRLWKKF